MEATSNKETLFKRSLLLSVLLSVAFAAVGNAFLYAAYYNSVVINWSYLICIIMIALFAVPVVWLFHNRAWYFPLFVFLFWVPFSILMTFVLGKIFPLTDSSYGLLLVYCFILNVAVVVLGIGLGMLINGCWALRNRLVNK